MNTSQALLSEGEASPGDGVWRLAGWHNSADDRGGQEGGTGCEERLRGPAVSDLRSTQTNWESGLETSHLASWYLLSPTPRKEEM